MHSEAQLIGETHLAKNRLLADFINDFLRTHPFSVIDLQLILYKFDHVQRTKQVFTTEALCMHLLDDLPSAIKDDATSRNQLRAFQSKVGLYYDTRIQIILQQAENQLPSPQRALSVKRIYQNKSVSEYEFNAKDRLETLKQVLKSQTLETLELQPFYEVKQTFGIDPLEIRKVQIMVGRPRNEIIMYLNACQGRITEACERMCTPQVQARIFSKGAGLICTQQIKSDSIIGFYIGEVYSAARWFDKQIVFRSRLQKANKEQSKSPFQQLMTNSGIVFIDPTRFGNDITNVNESIEPNGKLIVVEDQGYFKLALISTKNIIPGEEITIPLIESSEPCPRQSFIQKNVNILKSIGTDWLQQWATVTDSQTGNAIDIAITVDRCQYVMDTIGNTQPPLQILSDADLESIFWTRAIEKFKNESVMQEIHHIFNKFNILQGVQLIHSFEQIQSTNKMALTRFLLLKLSEILFKVQIEDLHSKGLAVILLFMAFTFTYFKPTTYQSFTCPPFDADEFEFVRQPKNQKKLPLEREYTPQYLWGQLIEWNKHTLKIPQSSIAQDRRGVLVYPSLSGSFITKHRDFPYGCKTHDSYLEYFHRTTPMQPDLSTWGYPNTYGIYGTIHFEEGYRNWGRYAYDVCSLKNFESKLEFLLKVDKDGREEILKYCEQPLKLYRFNSCADATMLVIEGDTAYEGH